MKRRASHVWLDLLTGLLFLGLGVLLVSSPRIAVPWYVLLLGLTAILSGISDIIVYVKTRHMEGVDTSTSLAAGVTSALVGLLLVLYPIVGQWVLNIMLPLWFIARCISRIASVPLYERLAGKALAIVMLCLNLAALLFGIILIFNNQLFTLSMGLLIAVELIMLGISNLIEGFGSIAASRAPYTSREG